VSIFSRQSHTVLQQSFTRRNYGESGSETQSPSRSQHRSTQELDLLERQTWGKPQLWFCIKRVWRSFLQFKDKDHKWRRNSIFFEWWPWHV